MKTILLIFVFGYIALLFATLTVRVPKPEGPQTFIIKDTQEEEKRALQEERERNRYFWGTDTAPAKKRVKIRDF